MILGRSAEDGRSQTFLRVCLRRAGKVGEARGRRAGAKNVGVCRFGSGGGEKSLPAGEKDKKSTRTFPRAGVFELCLTADSGFRRQNKKQTVSFFFFPTEPAWKTCSLNFL